MDACPGKRKTKFSNLRNHQGQFAIETVLLLAVLIGTFMLVTSTIKKKGLIPKLFNGPVKSIRNMTGYGTFREQCEGLGSKKKKQSLSQCHPNSITRALSSDPSKL